MRCAGALASLKSRQLAKAFIASTMGIRGLSTYVSARDRGDLFTEHKLRECQVVIGERSDANSQVYFQLILSFFK